MDNGIIIVKQLPVIQEQLQAVKEEVMQRVSDAKSLVCTEDTVKAVKRVRTELRCELNAFEAKRKEVKTAILKPYTDFEDTYKECVADAYKSADNELKRKIDSVEDEMKKKKLREVLDWFNEYLISAESRVGISLFEFVTFDKANINVTLSSSVKSLKEKAGEFVDRICDDINLIESQEHKEEMIVEYKQSLNVSTAIASVIQRHKAIEEQKQKDEERKKALEAAKNIEKKVDEIVPPTIETPVVERQNPDERMFTVAFKVTGTMNQLKELKEFLKNNNYNFE